MTMRAIYQDGVFIPSESVDLPGKSVVELEAKLVEPNQSGEVPNAVAQDEILGVLARRYNTGQTDAAARHDEHQP